MTTAENGRTILVAEDEEEVRSYFEMALRCQGYGVELAENGEEVLKVLREGYPIAAVLLDLNMPRKNGLQTLREIRGENRQLPVVMVSGVASSACIVEAMKCGANDFLWKPVSHDDLRRALDKFLEDVTTPPPLAGPHNGSRADAPDYIESNPRMRELESIIGQIAWSEAPVLIQGETGAGKEVLARRLHALSPRVAKPFVKLNCAALPSELVESELFGYERGAFTGAFQRKPGMFEMADGGTLLLDEIGDMDFKLQAKLLQVLQDHAFQRLGGKETIRVDVRIIAATHNDLEVSVARDRFRQDLYYRLNVISLYIPPLRERKDDILALADFLLRRHAPPDAALPALTPDLKQAILAYEWPGNVRELENVMRKLVILGEADAIARELHERIVRKSPAMPAVPAVPASTAAGTPILERVTQAQQQAETEAILAALHATHWNRKRAAALLKVDYKALLYRMKKLGIDERSETVPPPNGRAQTGKRRSEADSPMA